MDNNMFKNLSYIKPRLFGMNGSVNPTVSNGDGDGDGSKGGSFLGITIEEDESPSDITGHDIPGGN